MKDAMLQQTHTVHPTTPPRGAPLSEQEWPLGWGQVVWRARKKEEVPYFVP